MGIFYQSTAQSDEERLKKVLIADKHFNPERIKQFNLKIEKVKSAWCDLRL